MSNTIFTFDVHQPYSEGPSFQTRRSTAQGGREVRRKGQDQKLFAVFVAWFKFHANGNDLSDFEDFFEDRDGGYDTFLYKPRLQIFHKVTLEAVGTGDGAEDEWPLDSKHIDSSSLKVYVDAVLQTVTTHYSLSGNNTAPLITFVAAPGAVPITATYERYYPCRFDQDAIRYAPKSLGEDDDSSILQVQNLTWRQDFPGSHLV